MKYQTYNTKIRRAESEFHKPSDEEAISFFYRTNPSTSIVLKRIGPGTRGVVIASVQGKRVPEVETVSLVKRLDQALNDLESAIKARQHISTSNLPDTAHTEELVREADGRIAECERIVKVYSQRAGL